jgi:hypothetical protein
MYIGKIDELYRKGGAMQRFQIEMRVMEGKYKEAGELYEFFWDLEDHRGSCISVAQSHRLAGTLVAKASARAGRWRLTAF